MVLYYIQSNKYSIYERKNSKGKKVYDVVFHVTTVDGKSTNKWLRGAESKALAKERYFAFVTQYCELVRHNPLKKKKADKEILLVGDLVRQYMATLGNQNKQSVIYDKQKVFDTFILPLYNDTPLDKLTKEELYQWQDDLWASKNSRTKTYFSYKYLSKIRTYFNTFLTWCEQRYGIKNALNEVVKPKRRQPKKEMSFWTREEFDRFLAVVDDDMYHALFTFLFYTGRRKGEIFALHKTDVREKEITFDKSVNRRTYGLKTWEITSTKAEKTCSVPICSVVQKEIQHYKPPKEGNFYFGGEEPLAPATVDRRFKHYTELADLPPIRIHDLRHSFVSMLIHLGASVFTIADLISDNVEQIHKTYGHLYQQDKIDIISKM
jgi:integrase